MKNILEYLSLPTEGPGQVWAIAGLGALMVLVLDLFNIWDLMGFVKKTMHSFLPGVFKADKFRPAENSTVSTSRTTGSLLAI